MGKKESFRKVNTNVELETENRYLLEHSLIRLFRILLLAWYGAFPWGREPKKVSRKYTVVCANFYPAYS